MFDLTAKKKEVNEARFSWFFWRQILEKTGAGYVLGVGFFDDDPGKYVYNAYPDNTGSPLSNDGYEVTDFEAKCMAACCRGYVSVRRFMGEDNVMLKEIERFAGFAECSEGFRID
jgi:hypothetical protein